MNTPGEQRRSTPSISDGDNPVQIAESRISVSHFVGLARHVDIESFLEELDAAPDLWLLDTSRQRKVRCQRHTRNIFLRAPKKPLPPGAKNANDVHESRTVPAARRFPRTLAWCESIAAALGGKLGRATLVTLLPHSRVYPHVDAGAYYRIRDRFHLVLKSPLGSPLTCAGEMVLMRPGELWAFDNKARHWADNPSSHPRVHLIFDVQPAPGRGFFVYPPESSTSSEQSASSL